jgi:hypothetical protein
VILHKELFSPKDVILTSTEFYETGEYNDL